MNGGSANVDSYYEAGTTRTKANSTLYISFSEVSDVPRPARAVYLETLFSKCPGYTEVRQVRQMVFVDFVDIKSATAAMMRYHGHNGLIIDYDKDVGVAVKRKREQAATAARHKRDAQSGSYYCARCGTKALRTAGTLLSSMPTRSTDGAAVVDEGAGQLAALMLDPLADAQPARVARAKGVEKQFRLGCRSCGALVGYRSTPTAQAGKYLYVHPEHLTEFQPSAMHTSDAAVASHESAASAHADDDGPSAAIP